MGTGKSTYNTSMVRATPSDFICEIEKLANNNLPLVERTLFFDVYTNGQQPDFHFKENKHSIQETLGKLFIELEIHPIEKYFQVKDTR